MGIGTQKYSLHDGFDLNYISFVDRILVALCSIINFHTRVNEAFALRNVADVIKVWCKSIQTV